jgi:hypothetical protein
MKRSVFSLMLVLAAVSCSSESTDPPAAAGDNSATSNDPSTPSPGTPGGGESSSGSAAPQNPGETPPNGESHAPLFVGRFDTTDPKGPRATWPGARILTRFEGTAVSVKMSEFAEPWMEGAPSYWEVRIDKGDWKPIAMIADNTEHVFELATGLPAGPHEVELFKRSETQTGMTQFLGFDFHGGKSLPPPARQTRKIEVMGDSQSTGFGIEKTDAPNTDCPGADHGGQWQNFRKAWGARLGERFDAEVHGIVYSGKGVIQNVWPTDGDTLVRYYGRTNPNPAIQNSSPQLFDLASWVPDVIVMAQGAMDFNSGVDYGVFREAYRKFIVDTLRARGKDTHIFMSVLGNGGRGSIPQIANELIAEGKARGDDKLHLFVAEPYVWTEMLACNGHGVPAWHQRIADALATEIVKVTGWQ